MSECVYLHECVSVSVGEREVKDEVKDETVGRTGVLENRVNECNGR